MPITIQYGPISAALGLAQQAGDGQGFAQQRSSQLAAQQQAQQAQDEIDRQNSTMIQDSMQQQENSARNQLSAGAQAQQAASERANYQLQQQGQTERNLQLQQQIGYQNGMLGVQQQNAATRQTAAGTTADYRQGELGNQQIALENHADQTLLQSQAAQTKQVEEQIKNAQAQAVKIRANPLSNDKDAQPWDDQVKALQAQLQDSTDPSTGAPVYGLNTQMKIAQARIQKRSQQQAAPALATQAPWGNGSANIQMYGQQPQQIANGQPVSGQAQQQPQSQVSQGGQQQTPANSGDMAVPAVYQPLLVGAAAQLKLPVTDPRVLNAVKQQLQSMGYRGIQQ
jgi:hypothetical protein